MMKGRTAFSWIALVVLGLLAASSARGANDIKPGRLELYPTWTAAGLEVSYSGDDNENSKAEFDWRRKGEDTWRKGVEMTFDRKRRLIWASIWPLEQGEGIEAKVTLFDPDSPPEAKPAELAASATTKKMVLEPKGGRALLRRRHGPRALTSSMRRPTSTYFGYDAMGNQTDYFYDYPDRLTG